MPRYYFHLYDDIVALDEEGAELPDLEAAKETALQAARDMIGASVQDGHINLSHRIEVADERGDIVAHVAFREAFTITE